MCLANHDGRRSICGQVPPADSRHICDHQTGWACALPDHCRGRNLQRRGVSSCTSSGAASSVTTFNAIAIAYALTSAPASVPRAAVH